MRDADFVSDVRILWRSMGGTTDSKQGADLLERAATALPNGVYGHVTRQLLWPGAPQFVERADGSRFWDVDGNEYVDLMCSWGPILLGHRHPEVEEAVDRQHARVDCGNGPTECMVELAERMISIVDHAEWSVFAKNGSDATTLCLTLARAHTGRAGILIADGAYHGALPWCNPEPLGSVPSDRAHFSYYTYNDLESVARAAESHRGDLAGIIVSPFRHDAGLDQEDVDPDFARGLREICDRTGALLILDDVRAGFRVAFGSSWEPIGVRPDLSAWGKAIGNGYPLAAVLGTEEIREAAAKVFMTGSFWFTGDAMAAALATLGVLERDSVIAQMKNWGDRFHSRLAGAADRYGLEVNITGPSTMPYLSFPGDDERKLNDLFAGTCADAGLYIHPRHNWFVSAALDDDDLELAANAVDLGMKAIAERGVESR